MPLRTQEQIAKLPIPGGWKWETVTIGEHSWRLLLPADADSFLKDAPAMDEWPDPFWAELWPTANTMAEILLAQPWPAETSVLELGCGCGFVGLAAAACGWRVTFSDYVPFAVELALANARGNGYENVAGEVTDWRQAVADQRYERILACDCLYDPELHQPLLNTLRARLQPGGLVWLCDPGRGGMAEQLVREAREQHWQAAMFDAALQPQENLPQGEFRLIQLQ